MTKKADTIEIDISGIRYDLANMVREQVKEAIDEHLKAAVEKEVHKIAEDYVRKNIAEAAKQAIEEGWTKTDEYGREQGKTSVKDLLLAQLTKRDSYSNRGTWLDQKLEALLTEAISKSVGPDIIAAQKRFKEMLDTSIQERLTKALREAMGLK